MANCGISCKCQIVSTRFSYTTPLIAHINPAAQLAITSSSTSVWSVNRCKFDRNRTHWEWVEYCLPFAIVVNCNSFFISRFYILFPVMLLSWLPLFNACSPFVSIKTCNFADSFPTFDGADESGFYPIPCESSVFRLSCSILKRTRRAYCVRLWVPSGVEQQQWQANNYYYIIHERTMWTVLSATALRW